MRNSLRYAAVVLLLATTAQAQTPRFQPAPPWNKDTPTTTTGALIRWWMPCNWALKAWRPTFF
ncbi:hypothetical protein [Hymenobacter cellulosilyticus]|uniref:Uncharacterized protein n=1 Tax=Hymenobacter cellulosilyticus TaxID=2932248 RepID=A0A8T9Q312_9BACT|nr:hypothetical protein [Hymenobacter cellulosilyticus]UOQ70170.1 hypothetical protein MUN79_15520 [Hymenobacter cellulosilyticus]